MSREYQVIRMKEAALEAMKEDEQSFIYNLRESLQNMQTAANGIDFPMSFDGLSQMMKVLRDDLGQQYPRKSFERVYGTNKEAYPIYQDLHRIIGAFQVWISKKETRFFICVDAKPTSIN